MEHQAVKKIDAVFEGGGVKGSGLVGAVAMTEQLGYEFVNVAGTSAGAIIAALVAAGYTAAELKQIMDELDYLRLKDKGALGTVPIIGLAANLVLRKGIYEGDFFEGWIRELLTKKGVKTFGDLIIEEYAEDPMFRYKLQVIVSDISRGQLLVMPGDSRDFGVEPDDLDVAFAVRMSMSIPFFYKPIKLRTTTGEPVYLVDGGLLSNFPLWLLDGDPSDQPWPTLGYKLVEPEEGKPHRIFGPITLFAALFSTMMEAHDARYIKDVNFMRTIPIPTLGVQTTEFSLSTLRKEALYQSGLTAAQDFFSHWSFEDYKEQMRTLTAAHRRETVWKK